VSILIATTGNRSLLGPCLKSVLELSTYDNFEMVVSISAGNRHRPERARLLDQIAREPLVRVLEYPYRPFNYSWVNNQGAAAATGDLLCFLNDDTVIITPDWLEKLVSRVVLDGVGAAGPMMYYPDDTIQHAGVLLGIGGVAVHPFQGRSRGDAAKFGRIGLERDVSCITAACMMIRKDVFKALGGFDETLDIAFNDVDLCVRLRAARWRIVWTPTAELYHRESFSLGRHDARERAQHHAAAAARMRQCWGPVLDADPFYNRNLSLDRAFDLAFPPR